MDFYEQEIIKMANSLEPYEFIGWVENRAKPNKKGISFLAIGETLLKSYHYFLALTFLKHSLEYFIKEVNRKGELACYGDIGVAYYKLGDFSDSIVYSKKGIEIALELNDKSAESACYLNLSIAFHFMDNFDESKKYVEKALKIKEAIHDKAGIMGCYISFNSILSKKGDLRRAIEYSEKALKIALDLKDQIAESICYVNLSYDYRNLGELNESLEYVERALRIKEAIHDKAGIMHCYVNKGLVYRGLSDYRKAMECQTKGLEIALELNDKYAESACCLNISATLHFMGDFDESKKYVEKALKIKEAIHDKAGIVHCYTALSAIHNDLGDHKEAIEYAQKALKLAQNIKLIESIPYCYGALGSAYLSSGNFGETEKFAKLAVQKALEIGNKELEARCYGLMGSIQENKGNFTNTIECAKKMLDIAKEIGDLTQEQQANLLLGFYFCEIDSKMAYEYLKRSIALSEIIIGKLIEEPHKLKFYEKASTSYQIMVPLCLKEDRLKEAFEYVEGSKSRVILELIATNKTKPVARLTKESKALLEKESICLTRLREIQTRHLRPNNTPIEFGETDKILDQLRLIYDEMDKFDPEYVSVRRAKPLSLDTITDLLSSLKSNTLLVEYFLTAKEMFIFTISSKNKQLNVENFEKEVVNYPEYGEMGASWLDLSDLLIGKISELLKGHDLICFVPYGQLHCLPLHALKLDGEPLIKKYPVVYYPSASLIKFSGSKGSGKLNSCVSFGVVQNGEPFLKAVVEETSSDTARLFDGRSFNGSAATKEVVFKESPNKDIVHFSCHGFFDAKNPVNSGMELYDDKVLTASEVFDMTLDAELVTLAACETAISQRSLGDELIGLTRSFLYAGASSVVASLWPVDSLSTQELMKEFYKNLKDGVDKAKALQKAQKEIMQKYSHPNYWAPFILVGKPN
jgi:CHAT domain-containing protein